MSSKFYPNGIGGTLGDQLDTCKPLITSGNVWYVSSLIGTDAASPAGQNREKPLATIAQALTNALDDDIVVFLSGHTETTTALTTVSKRLTLIGEGTTSGKPAVQFKTNVAGTTLLSLTATDVELRNIYFPEAVQTNTGVKVNISGTNARIVGCYFDCGAKDTGAAIKFTVSSVRIENCTFISTATLRSAQPLMAIQANPTTAFTNIELLGVTVSAGTVGFSNYSAIDMSGAASVARLKVIGLSLLLGADMDLPATWTGYVNNQLSTGGSRVSAP